MCRFILKKNNIQLLFLGALIKRKGIYNLIHALKALDDINLLEQYNIYLNIGGCDKEKRELKDIVYSMGLEERIKFWGWIEKTTKDDLLNNSDIFILPSFNKGLPVAILEALSYGLPIISIQVGSIDEAVIDGYNGSRIAPNNDKELVEKLIVLIENKKLMRQYAINSRILCEEKYNKGLYSIYRSIVDR